jgi:hypothetical protein
MPKMQPMDPPATPGRGFFFEDAEISQRAVTSPEPFQKMKEIDTITLDGNLKKWPLALAR